MVTKPLLAKILSNEWIQPASSLRKEKRFVTKEEKLLQKSGVGKFINIDVY